MLGRLVFLTLSASLFTVSSSIASTWRVPDDYATIQAAIDSPAVVAGDTIVVAAGSHVGATVTKSVEIRGEDGAVIVGGPNPWPGTQRVTGFFLPAGGAGSGATISHFRFEVMFPIFSRGANDVTVSHNVMVGPTQGVTNWAGHWTGTGSFARGWTISHNKIVDLTVCNGGGIGILIGDARGGQTASDNVVTHNTITGTVALHPTCGTEYGGYNGTGIVLYADYRWGALGGEITFNEIARNAVSLSSTIAELGVDVAAFEITDVRDDPDVPMVIRHNAVTFNDFRGTTLQIALTPAVIDQYNQIARNLGNNRGRGRGAKVIDPE